MTHPYKDFSDSSFWSRAVSRDYDPSAIVDSGSMLLRSGDKIVTAGSCFAANIVRFVEAEGFDYIRMEPANPAFEHLPKENFGYDSFSAKYGNIYTARQLLQLLRRATGRFVPKEDRWIVGGEVVDPLRPGLRYKARSDREFDAITARHLNAVRAAFEQMDVFIFTLGLTEAWISTIDGTVFPACPGTVSGVYDKNYHAFVNFNAAETAADLFDFMKELKQINPNARMILTVSPVPLVATASGDHVLKATIYSKSVLRVAAEEVSKELPDVTYFPAYEIVTGPQAPSEYFEADRRNVSEGAIAAVMGAFLAHCAMDQRKVPQAKQKPPVSLSAQLSTALADAECEEIMSDRL